VGCSDRSGRSPLWSPCVSCALAPWWPVFCFQLLSSKTLFLQGSGALIPRFRTPEIRLNSGAVRFMPDAERPVPASRAAACHHRGEWRSPRPQFRVGASPCSDQKNKVLPRRAGRRALQRQGFSESATSCADGSGQIISRWGQWKLSKGAEGTGQARQIRVQALERQVAGVSRAGPNARGPQSVFRNAERRRRADISEPNRLGTQAVSVVRKPMNPLDRTDGCAMMSATWLRQDVGRI